MLLCRGSYVKVNITLLGQVHRVGMFFISFLSTAHAAWCVWDSCQVCLRGRYRASCEMNLRSIPAQGIKLFSAVLLLRMCLFFKLDLTCKAFHSLHQQYRIIVNGTFFQTSLYFFSVTKLVHLLVCFWTGKGNWKTWRKPIGHPNEKTLHN